MNKVQNMEDRIQKIIEETYEQSNGDRENHGDISMDVLMEEFDPADLGEAIVIASQKFNEFWRR